MKPTSKEKSMSPSGMADGDSGYVLSNTEWHDIQTYVEGGLRLPTNDTMFEHTLPAPPPGGVAIFEPLIKVYKNVYDHCYKWKRTSVNTIVNTASDIVEYSISFKRYGDALIKYVNAIEGVTDQATIESYRKKFVAIFNRLKTDVVQNATNARNAAKLAADFSEDTTTDRNNLLNEVTYVNNKLESESLDIKDLRKQITDAQTELDEWTKKYKHDCVVAETTPTYSWFFPGIIAAGIVAGVYGAKADQDLKHMKELRAQIKNLNTELQSVIMIQKDMDYVSKDIQDIKASMDIVVPILNKIEGIWNAIAADIDNVVSQLDDKVINIEDVIIEDDINRCIDLWTAVAAHADKFRVNAYITVTDGSVAA